MDHPRSRGVYSYRCPTASHSPGSSPLARGLRYRHGGNVGRSRIIPARAGFTLSNDVTQMNAEDHPRSRGVYEMPPPLSLLPVGSSPLARGLLENTSQYNPVSRIIPARAGFTASYPCTHCHCQDHPRSRGVYPEADILPAPVRGSSPLARGLLWLRARRPARRRDHPRSRGVYLSPRMRCAS